MISLVHILFSGIIIRMTRRKIIVGNWKMNPVSSKEAEKIMREIAKLVSGIKKTEIALCPPVVYLEKLKKISKKIPLGGQNIHPGDVGAFTGETSATMLANAGGRYVILGHSERRRMGETNEDINKKLKAALSARLVPVLCLGENHRDEQHAYLSFIKSQAEECLEGVAKASLNTIIIAYEPVWAIGVHATRPATPAEFLEISIYIRKVLSDKFGAKNVNSMRIIYGGSVNPDTVLPFLIEGNADGFLPGRDSLSPKHFASIIRLTENINHA
jgi:triosephosphate isomerase